MKIAIKLISYRKRAHSSLTRERKRESGKKQVEGTFLVKNESE
jgi:hypothetical protein